MQDGWFVVSKILINKFDFYIVNFNKLTTTVLRRRDAKFERCFPAMTILKYSARNPKNEHSCKKEALCPVDADDKKDKVICRSLKHQVETLYLQPSSQSVRCLHSSARLNTYGSDRQAQAHTSWCFITLYARSIMFID